MSFLKKLFGGGGAKPAAPPKTAEHKGFVIAAAPYKEAGQYQTAGVISKEVGGVRKEHRFIRADRFAALEDAANHALVKGRQIVDEQGERMFADQPRQ
jgi:hypothetical protein